MSEQEKGGLVAALSQSFFQGLLPCRAPVMEITKAQAQSGAISQKRLKAKPALIDVELFVQPTGVEQIAFDPRLSAEHEGQHHQIECRRVAFQNKIEYAAE